MDIHEYQAKELLAGFGVAIPRGGVAYSPEQAVYRASEIGGDRWAVKAQIHSGARGKAGGIKLCSSEDEVRQVGLAFGEREAAGGQRHAGHRVAPQRADRCRQAVLAEQGVDRPLPRRPTIATTSPGSTRRSRRTRRTR